MENGSRRTVYSFYSNQTDLAREFNVTRQALSIHVKRLRELGMVQVGRGFVNVTESGLKAAGYNTNPVIVTVRLSPQKRLEIFKRISDLPAVEMFRVTGEMDIVLVVEQEKLDQVLGTLDQIDGVLETKSLVSIETLK
jgi:DNA-binding Lrp family transcriptional regulator